MTVRACTRSDPKSKNHNSLGGIEGLVLSDAPGGGATSLIVKQVREIHNALMLPLRDACGRANSHRMQTLLPGPFADIDEGGVVLARHAARRIAEKDFHRGELAVRDREELRVAETVATHRLAVVEHEHAVAGFRDGDEVEAAKRPFGRQRSKQAARPMWSS
jgi:hypothetical protein